MTAFTHAPVPAVSPRLFKRHQRYANFSRLNYSKQQIEFIDTQAVRLGSSDSVIFAKLNTYTADQIAAAVNLAAIP